MFSRFQNESMVMGPVKGSRKNSLKSVEELHTKITLIIDLIFGAVRSPPPSKPWAASVTMSHTRLTDMQVHPEQASDQA